jgi:hypothetical protein
MDLDHRPEEIKIYTLSKLQFITKPIDIVLDEIAKCDAVCSNCHRERTHLRKVALNKKCYNNKKPQQSLQLMLGL